MKLTKGGLIKIETPEELQDLCQKAKNRFDGFTLLAKKIVTKRRAKTIRAWRCSEAGCSWRGIAGLAYEKFEGKKYPDWYPESNQLMGMALCEAAAKHFGEDYMVSPWN